jgi:hypothetical protein
MRFAVLLAVTCCLSGDAARVNRRSHTTDSAGKEKEAEAAPSALMEAEQSQMNEEGEDESIEAHEGEAEEEEDNTVNPGSALKLNSIAAIKKGGSLVPELEKEDARIYKVKELWALGNNYNVKDQTDFSWTTWKFKGGNTLNVRGKWSSKYFGRGVSHVKDPKTGRRLFKIKRSRHAWNPANWVGRFSYRIMAPYDKNTSQALYTINKDYFGRGFAWSKEEWRIYRGTMGYGDTLAYYCVGSYLGWDTKCYESEKDYDQGRKGLTVWGKKEVQHLEKKKPVAVLKQKWYDLATIVGTPINILPDAYYVKVAPGADTALFIAFATILDTAHDINGNGKLVEIGPPLPPVNKLPIKNLRALRALRAAKPLLGVAKPGKAAIAVPAKVLEKVTR